jgi:hypothetical protein
VSFDFEAQRAETARLWAEMAAEGDLPAKGLLDLHFEGGEGADATEFIGWLEDNGFDVEHYPADEEEREQVEAQTAAMTLSPETIHAEERRCTAAALRHGFHPTGWGFIAL